MGLFKMNLAKRIKIIWQFAKKHLCLFVIAELCILILYAVSLLLPLNLKCLIDDVLSGREYGLLPTIIFIYLLLFLIASATNVFYGYAWQRLNNSYILNLKISLYEKIIRAKAIFLSGINSGDCMSRIDYDAEQFLHAIQRNVFHFINSALLCIAIVVVVAQINFVITILLVCAALLPVVITRFYSVLMEKYARKSRTLEGELTGRLFELLKGIREIKLFSAFEWASRQLLSKFEKTVDYKNKMTEIDFALQKCIHLVNLLTSLTVYGYAAYLIADHQLSIGAFLAVIEYISLLHKKFNWILRICLEWQSRKVSIDRVYEILSLECEVETGAELDEINSIVFDHVSFGYGGKTVLNDISFTIRKGEKIAVVGESGCGKTTLVGLLTGLYQPCKGAIFVNERGASEISLSSIRKKMAVVSQDVALFEGTIMENLTVFGKNGMNAVDRSIQTVGLAEKIYSLKDRTETIIDSRNNDLSGGQKQRLMIARALIRNSGFLVFDEAFSALDRKAQREIAHKIIDKNQETVVLISHDSSYLKNCDRIFVLNHGTIERVGTHRELLHSSATYRSLFCKTEKC